MKNHATWIATVALIAALGWTGSARAAFVQVTFNDLTGGGADLSGQAGGTGLTGIWDPVANTAINVINGDLTAPVGTGFALTQSGTGQSASGAATSAPQLQVDRGLAEAMTGEIWFSFLIRPQTGARVGLDFNAGIPSSDGNASGDALRVLAVNGDLRLISGVAFDVGIGGGALSALLNTDVLILGRIQVDGGVAGADPVRVWVNPDLSAFDPDTTPATLEALTTGYLASVTRIGVESYIGSGGTAGAIDLVTLSNGPDAFFDVTGVNLIPAPAALPAGLMLIAALAGRFRGRGAPRV